MVEDEKSQKMLKKGTVDSLFIELNSLPILERKAYLDDWIIHYASSNPIYETTDEKDLLCAHLFVKNDPIEQFDQIWIVGDSFGWDDLQYPLEKIKNTEWFYSKFTRPIGTRLHYLLSLNEIGSLTNDQKLVEKQKIMKLDNRNKSTAEEVRIHSIAQFPGFVQDLQIQTSKIKMKELRLPRKLQGTRSGEFAIIGRNEDPPSKLLIVHDGDASINFMKIDQIIKHGVDQEKWPNFAFVALSVQDSDRIQEYGGNRSQYPLYFREYILPTIEDYLDLSFKPEDIILCGSALGAWSAFDVVWNNSDKIKNVICQSSPWWWADDDYQKFINEVKETKKKNISRIYIDCGIYENNRLSKDTYNSNKMMAATLNAKKYNVMAKEYLMSQRYNSWSWAFPYALDYILFGEEKYQSPTGRKMSTKIDKKK